MNERRVFFYLAFLFALIFGIHLFRLADIPTGLYLDETSIGYNAALIAKGGADEHNISLPIYFKAFGEYKNPIYIYASALIFRLFGISEFNLRLTSFFFFAVAFALHALLVSTLFSGKKTILAYALLSFGLLPIVFVLSRISFELISQLTWVTAINLLTWIVFHVNNNNKPKMLQSLLLGLALGTSIYTYSTSRLLSLLSLGFLWLIYFKPENLRRLLVISLAFIAGLGPYILFSINNPGELTKRFSEVSYIDDSLSPIKKILIFGRNLSEYWSLDFLAVHGDSNLRHSTGYGGIVFLAVFILFLIGIINILNKRRIGRFDCFLLLNLLASPLAAALTSEGTPHALRSFLLAYYIVLISCYGVAFILDIPSRRLKRIMTISIATLLTIEIIGYLLHYFLIYASASIEEMGSFNLASSLQTAINRRPKQIIFINNPYKSYANLKFYQFIISNPDKIPLVISQDPTPTLGSCVVYHRKDEGKLSKFQAPFNDFESAASSNALQRMVTKKPAQGVMKVRCYEKS